MISTKDQGELELWMRILGRYTWSDEAKPFIQGNCVMVPEIYFRDGTNVVEWVRVASREQLLRVLGHGPLFDWYRGFLFVDGASVDSVLFGPCCWTNEVAVRLGQAEARTGDDVWLSSFAASRSFTRTIRMLAMGVTAGDGNEMAFRWGMSLRGPGAMLVESILKGDESGRR